MWFRRRRGERRRPQGAPPGDAAEGSDAERRLPAVRAERALVALAVHAQQLDQRLASIEARLDLRDAEAARAAEDHALETATHDELLEVRVHSARVAAELSRVSVELQARIDDLAVQIPVAVAENGRQQRARTLAESILDLSDSLDTQVIDLRHQG